jgi:hypothetical protein
VADPNDPYAGLPDWVRADLTAVDRQTKAQSGMFGQVYGNLATQSGADADAAARRLGTLAQLAGASYQPASVSSGAPGPYGQVAAPTLAPAVAGLPGALSDTDRQSMLMQAALATNTASQLPTLARAAGQTAAQTYEAGRQSDRNTYLSDARKAVLDQAAKDAALSQDESQFTRTLASTAEGRNLQLLLPYIQAQAKAGTAIPKLPTGFTPLAPGTTIPDGYSPVTLPDGTQGVVPTRGKTAKAPAPPRGTVGPFPAGTPVPRDYTALQNADGTVSFLKKVTTGAGSKASTTARNTLLNRGTKLVQQLYSEGINHRKDANKQDVADYYSAEEIFPRLLAQGVAPKDAYALVTSGTGKRINAQNTLNGLRSNGVEIGRAYALVKALTGTDLQTQAVERGYN